MFDQDNSLRQWLSEHLDWNQLHDLSIHGAANGFPGLSTYAQTARLYEAFESEIWELLEDGSLSAGFDDNIIAFIASLNGAKEVATGFQFINLCVWYAAETYACSIVEGGQDV